MKPVFKLEGLPSKKVKKQPFLKKNGDLTHCFISYLSEKTSTIWSKSIIQIRLLLIITKTGIEFQFETAEKNRHFIKIEV